MYWPRGHKMGLVVNPALAKRQAANNPHEHQIIQFHYNHNDIHNLEKNPSALHNCREQCLWSLNQMANSCKEIDCFAVTAERKYYKTFVKRSLRPREWQVSQFLGTIHVPRLGKERLLNEAAAMQFVSEHTKIPFQCCIAPSRTTMQYIW